MFEFKSDQDVNPLIKKIIDDCLNYDVNKRPNIKKILQDLNEIKL